MLGYQTCGAVTGTAGEALESFCRIIESSSEVVYADEGVAHFGVTLEAAADEATVSYLPVNWPGVVMMRTAGAIPKGADVFGARDGRIDGFGVGKKIGVAMDEATAAGDVIGVLAAGTLAPADPMTRRAASMVQWREDFLTGSVEDGHKFSETADKTDWLLTVIDDNPDEGEVCCVTDDAPGGILTLTTNDAANDSCELQLNGEPVKLAIGTRVRVGCRLAINDVDKANWFVGLAIADTTVMAGCTDRVGFECLHDGNIDCLVEQDSTESLVDTTSDITDGAVATMSSKAVVLEFEWDGVDSVRFYVDGALMTTQTDNGTTVLIPDDECLTPTICLNTSAAQVVTAFVDYIEVTSDRI